MGKSGKLGQAKFGQWKLGDVFVEGAPGPPGGGGGHPVRGKIIPTWEELYPDDDAAIAFVLSQI